MLRPHLTTRSATLGALLFASGAMLTGGSIARAQEAGGEAKIKPQSRVCQAALQGGQEKEKAGQLVEAQKLYRSCSDIACATATWHACVAANTHLRATLPSIVPVAVDDDGAPRADVEVKMDGQVIASQLTGLAIAVDPGPHEFSFSIDSEIFASTKIEIIEGERNRPLSVSYTAQASKPRSHQAATAQK